MLLLASIVAASFVVRPDVTRNCVAQPWLLVIPIVVAVAAAAIRLSSRGGRGFGTHITRRARLSVEPKVAPSRRAHLR